MTIRCKYQQSQYKFLGTKQKIKENDAQNKLDDGERMMSSSKVRISQNSEEIVEGGNEKLVADYMVKRPGMVRALEYIYRIDNN